MAKNHKEIARLAKQNNDIRIASYLLSDKQQQYYETTVIVGRGKLKREELHGRIHWIDNMMDSGSGKVCKIERSRLVRVNGEWV